ncbi:MAG TPA: BrnT family toxin [Acetobacteraceae bacterium]|nr:BrnT family toxin [Acetobacteraceae bacterium]
MKHGIDFRDAVRIWTGPTLERASDRAEEPRTVAFALMDGRVIAVVWTRRNGKRQIISAKDGTPS